MMSNADINLLVQKKVRKYSSPDGGSFRSVVGPGRDILVLPCPIAELARCAGYRDRNDELRLERNSLLVGVA
jgi:hypothetical protein